MLKNTWLALAVGISIVLVGSALAAAKVPLSVNNQFSADIVDAGSIYANTIDLRLSASASTVQLSDGAGVNWSVADSDAYITRSTSNTLRAGAGIASVFSAGQYVSGRTGASVAYTASTANVLTATGVAFASLTACGAGTNNFIQYVTDRAQWMQCENTNSLGWLPLATPAHMGGYYPGVTLGAGTIIAQSRLMTIITPLRLTYTVQNAGADGAHTFTVDAFDLTAGAALCTSSTISCNVGAGATSVNCIPPAGTASTAAADDIQLRINDASCITVGSGNLTLEYQ